MISGLPEEVTGFSGVDVIGSGSRIARDVTVYRFGSGDRHVVIGSECVIYAGVRLVAGDVTQHPATGVAIGDRVQVNVGCYLSGEGGLRIGDDVLIGPHAKLLSAGHEIDCGEPLISRGGLTYGTIQVGAGAWIGAGAIILQGVTVGTGAVVAAGSVVTRSIPDFAIVAGVPARLLRYRRGRDPRQTAGLLGRWFLRLMPGRLRLDSGNAK